MKKIKWVIIIIIILIIILSAILLLTNNEVKQDNSKIEENDVEVLTQEEIDQQENDKAKNIPPEISTDVGYEEFFTISNCISQYLDIINKDNSSYYGKDDEGNNVLIVSEEDINKRINALKSTNSNTRVQMLNEKNIFTLIDVIKINQEDVKSYAAYGFTMNLNNEYLKDMYFIVNLDTKNSTFSIEQLRGSYSNLTEITTNKLESIEENEYNKFAYQEVNDQYKYKKYLSNFKRIILCKPEFAYEYLDEDYKNKRFGSYDYFNKYIQENRNILEKIAPKKYKTNDNSTEVIITDQNGNKITFEVTGVMKFKVKIDNYIVLSEDDINQYNGLEEQEKIRYNIERWIKMINSKDYRFAYEYLDETFRGEKFGTEENFEQFMKEKYPSRYEYSVSKTEKNGDVYTAEIEFYIDGEEFSEKYMTIIMKLDEGTDFSMSFDNQ